MANFSHLRLSTALQLFIYLCTPQVVCERNWFCICYSQEEIDGAFPSTQPILSWHLIYDCRMYLSAYKFIYLSVSTSIYAVIIYSEFIFRDTISMLLFFLYTSTKPLLSGRAMQEDKNRVRQRWYIYVIVVFTVSIFGR